MQCETNHETKEIILQRGPWKRGVGGVGDPKCSKKERCFKRCQRAFERIHEVIFNLSQYLKSCKRFTILSPYMDCSCRIGLKLSESENFATLDIHTNERVSFIECYMHFIGTQHQRKLGNTVRKRLICINCFKLS